MSFATMVQRRYISILQCAAIAIGVPALFAEKKLHAFRVQCTNVLGSTGASEAEREAHIGWQSTVQSRHYASLKHTAMNARTPHLLAGRSGRDEPPHPMWQCLGQAPGDGYWQRVRALAASAGFLPGVELCNPEFQSLVAERVATGNPEREDSPAYLLKRLKLLEKENTDLRKRTRPQEAVEQLTELVSGLKTNACDSDFPQRCFEALDRLSALIEEASERGNLGLPQSTADGKHWQRSSYLARSSGSTGMTRSHITQMEDAHGSRVSTKTWKAFKESALD